MNIRRVALENLTTQVVMEDEESNGVIGSRSIEEILKDIEGQASK